MDDRVFKLHVLPAANGDALVVEYGDDREQHFVLVDGGVGRCADEVRTFLGPDAVLELLIVTHIDNDHIAGIVKLLESPDSPLPREVWFNGYRHLPASEVEEMGPVEAERLTALLLARGWNWNTSFGGAAVAIAPAPATPPCASFEASLGITVLSPGRAQLERLRSATTWKQIVDEAGLNPTVPPPEPPLPVGDLEPMGFLDIRALAAKRTTADTAPANGSSIAILVEFADRSCLLAADAHPDVLIDGIDRLVGTGVPLNVDVFKLPHHGSRANVTSELLDRVEARSYVVSTDGSGNQRHPHDETIARVIMHGGDDAEIAFNYRTDRTARWDDPQLKDEHHYRTRYPDSGILTIDLMTIR